VKNSGPNGHQHCEGMRLTYCVDIAMCCTIWTLHRYCIDIAMCCTIWTLHIYCVHIAMCCTRWMLQLLCVDVAMRFSRWTFQIHAASIVQCVVLDERCIYSSLMLYCLVHVSYSNVFVSVIEKLVVGRRWERVGKV
jgi:hypothetical protein